MFNKMKNKFDLCDKVANLKLGCKFTGIITCIMLTEDHPINQTDPSRWNDTTPLWRKKALYGILLDAPSKGVSFEEFKDAYTGEEERDDAYHREKYDKFPTVGRLLHPEDDLVLMSEMAEQLMEIETGV